MAGNEAKSRIKINRLLEAAGWRLLDDENGPANVLFENNVKITKSALDEFGEDFEKTKNGYIDFLLLGKDGHPLAVLEAKGEGKSPLDGKEQARTYAKAQNVRFIILSNGNMHYYWDIETGNPTTITQFPTQESFKHSSKFKPKPENLVNELVDHDYVVVTQNPDYSKDPRWDDESQRDDYLRENGLMLLRKYQLKAIHSIQNAVKEGNDRFLFEMATGTGKTLIAAATIKLFLRTGNATRVLFLVDRLELEDQAMKAFTKYLKNDYKTVIYKQNRNDWRKAEIVVTTVQSLLVNNKYQSLFSPTDFELVISDESHRSIGGNARAVFEYFVGYKLGLTATPKDYLKNIENIHEKDPRKLERRLLLDTYKTFGCESGEPTYRYTLMQGVNDEHLINPIVIDARTEISTEFLSEEGYCVPVPNSDGDDVDTTFFNKDFEKKFYSEKTNKIFCKTFIENALRDPISGEIGKSLVFCVSQNHASKITQILNEYIMEVYPGKYNSDFAVQVTSRIDEAQQYSINFANNNLLGKTNWLEAYNSSKARVCVTVGMMTTGYDCTDILNLCLMRPIFSPTDFVQIKGRGTRKHKFEYKKKDDMGEVEVLTDEKETYKMFDFFANCEYFEEKFEYDKVLKLPVGIGTGGGDGTGAVSIDEFISTLPDPLKSLEVIPIGAEGMKVDRKLFGKFEEVVKEDDYIADKIQEGDFDAAETYIHAEIFNKPEEFYDLKKLRKAAKVDRRLSLREILEKIFELIPNFKSKNELLDDEFDKFVAIYKPDPEYILPIKNFLKAYIVDNRVREIVESKEYAQFATHPAGEDFRTLSKELRDLIPEYVKDYISLNTYL